jgi:hypothetical protein
MSSRAMPKSVLLFGLSNSALGALGLIGGLNSLLRPQQTVAMQVYQQVDLPTQSMEWLRLAMILSPLSSLLMLVCGVALLQRRTWGLKLAAYYGIGSIGFSLIASGINISRIIDRTSNPIVLNVIFGILVSVFLGLVYKTAMVYSLTRPAVQTAFATQSRRAKVLKSKSKRAGIK